MVELLLTGYIFFKHGQVWVQDCMIVHSVYIYRATLVAQLIEHWTSNPFESHSGSSVSLIVFTVSDKCPKCFA